jgi:hypothetical protein
MVSATVGAYLNTYHIVRDLAVGSWRWLAVDWPWWWLAIHLIDSEALELLGINGHA